VARERPNRKIGLVEAVIEHGGTEKDAVDCLLRPRTIDSLLRGKKSDTASDSTRIWWKDFQELKQRPACHHNLTLRMFHLTIRETARIVLTPSTIRPLLRHQPLGGPHDAGSCDGIPVARRPFTT
jgi:hypothetical protein